MAKVIVMPKLGLTMTEGLIGTWYKDEGEAVAAGENLFSVETDKLTNDIESTETGLLRKILKPAGATVDCMVPVAIIAAANEDITALLAVEAPALTTEPPTPLPDPTARTTAAAAASPGGAAASGGRIIAAPAAKKLAAEKDVDLAQVTGTGPKGRITIKDVEAHLAAAPAAPKASPMARQLATDAGLELADIPADGRIMKADVRAYAAGLADPAAATDMTAAEERRPMSSMRRIIARRMTESWTYPAVTMDIKIDAGPMKALRQALKDTCKIGYTDMIIKCTAVALTEHPLLNAAIEGEEIVLKHYVNIGFAAALDEGLLVPVIKHADRKGLAAIAAEVRQLADDARSGRLSPDALSDGTFSISNLGMYGIESFSPIINLPEVAILGVNAIQDELILRDEEVTVRPTMKLSLTTDHRAVDGAVAAQFLQRLKALLENPGLLLL